ncbi:response regulator [Mucilaginibacter ginsenosidivorax]|jgi:DNA-binding response OmpR family regulator|uniref:Response regulator n=1 Tax=Mucilaginibacter ginsenosidivorax TaxID=862126 RepID=A0A5B8W7K9_9SPHI|nr:response regulator [Mucilaginibacter ginsenosidivorax]QEC79884.1 response regulator [Mucilaginibacter ginsenosidivorax]
MKTTGSKKKILILDKNSRMLSVIDDIMYYGNFDVHLTYDPNAIYDKAKVIHPDLIILDYLLLDMDCALVCQDFKDDEQLRQVPIIVVTAFKSKKAELESYKCDALFVKPLDMELLASRMEYLMAS